MFNAFYAKLALANIRRDKRTYVPHIIATAVISGVYLLIAGLMFSYGLANLTSGKTTQACSPSAWWFSAYSRFSSCCM